ncbi:hypothetical protein N9N67_05835 [Bacteriovoracaceae bacterium]|nr:hypothetical protein [Bacteriovoracaceae bacterium]
MKDNLTMKKKKKNWAEKLFFPILFIILFMVVAPYFIPKENDTIKSNWKVLERCSQHACEYAAIQRVAKFAEINSIWFKAFIVEGEIKDVIEKRSFPITINKYQRVDIIFFKEKNVIFKVKNWRPISPSNLQLLFFPKHSPKGKTSAR